MDKLEVGQRVRLIFPPDRFSRWGIVEIIDEPCGLVRCRHGSARHPQKHTWFNRDQVASAREYNALMQEREKQREAARRAKRSEALHHLG